LDDDLTVVDNVAEGREFVSVDGGRRHVIGYLQDFLFSPDRARQPVRALSGGERNRLLLARLFAQPSNVLVLDEPTNDLDLDALEVLEEQLGNYSGTVLMVSHDRAFLNNIVTSTLVFEKGPGAATGGWLGPDDGWYVNEYVGGYDDWVVRRPQPLVAASPEKKEPRPRVQSAAVSRRRLTYKERKELDGMPGHIEALEAEQAQLHARLADPAFYRQGDAEGIARARERAAGIGAELEAAYLRWEELTALAESG
jgi:ATP-binding cassette subfamily F protein uup